MAEPYINGSRKLGDWEFQKFREDSAGKPSISVCNPDKSDITSTVESNQTDGSQITKITDSWGDEIGATMTDEMMIAEKTRVAGGVFNGTAPDANFYTTAVVANGTATISNSILDLATTTDSGSSVLLYTNSVGRYIGGNTAHLRGVVRIDNKASASNTTRFGLTSTSTLGDSIFFELVGATLSVVAKTTGLPDVKVSSGAFNGDSAIYVPTGNFSTLEIIYSNKLMQFYINKVLIHTLTETTTAICGTRHLRPFAQNFNTGVGVVAHAYCQVLSLFSWGKTKTQPKYYFQQGTTAGVQLKVGIGSIHMMNISGVINNANVTLYDGTSTAGTIIYSTGAMGAQTIPINVPFNEGIIFTTGLFLTITAANCNCQVIYE